MREVLLHQPGGEPVESGGYRRVRGEEVARPRRGECRIEGHAGRFHERMRPLQNDQGSMTFVQMTDVGREVQGFEEPPAAHPEHDLLLQP